MWYRKGLNEPGTCFQEWNGKCPLLRCTDAFSQSLFGVIVHDENVLFLPVDLLGPFNRNKHFAIIEANVLL